MYRCQNPTSKHILCHYCITWNYFSETVNSGLYNEVKDNVVYPKLREAEYFSSTTDLWTSCAAHPYPVTDHFVDKDGTLQSFYLDTTPLLEDYTGPNISIKIGTYLVLVGWLLQLIILFQLTSSYTGFI